MSGISTPSAVLRLLPLILAASLAVGAGPASMVLGKSPAFPSAKYEDTHSTQDTLSSFAPSKSALFNKEAGSSRSAMSSGWFLFGLYVLIALIFSGLSGYMAVSKG